MKPMRVGTKVRCKDNAFGELNLTIGKVYRITKPYKQDGGSNQYIYVINDKGGPMMYMDYRFALIENKEFTDEEYESLLV